MAVVCNYFLLYTHSLPHIFLAKPFKVMHVWHALIGKIDQTFLLLFLRWEYFTIVHNQSYPDTYPHLRNTVGTTVTHPYRRKVLLVNDFDRHLFTRGPLKSQLHLAAHTSEKGDPKNKHWTPWALQMWHRQWDGWHLDRRDVRSDGPGDQVLVLKLFREDGLVIGHEIHKHKDYRDTYKDS